MQMWNRFTIQRNTISGQINCPSKPYTLCRPPLVAHKNFSYANQKCCTTIVCTDRIRAASKRTTNRSRMRIINAKCNRNWRTKHFVRAAEVFRIWPVIGITCVGNAAKIWCVQRVRKRLRTNQIWRSTCDAVRFWSIHWWTLFKSCAEWRNCCFLNYFIFILFLNRSFWNYWKRTTDSILDYIVL